MDCIALYPKSPDTRAIQKAAKALQDGKLVITPTDSNPAIAADPRNTRATAELCALKGINPQKQTLTLICSDISQAAQVAQIDNRTFALLKKNTPGPFTFILPPASSLPKTLKARKQIGIRIPGNPIALLIADRLGHPYLSGSLAQTDPYDLEAHIETLIADASANPFDQPQSTAIISLIDSNNPEIIRQGPVELI